LALGWGGDRTRGSQDNKKNGAVGNFNEIVVPIKDACQSLVEASRIKAREIATEVWRKLIGEFEFGGQFSEYFSDGGIV
jgi:hypothetical protein